MARSFTPYGSADARLISKVGGQGKSTERLGSQLVQSQLVSKVGLQNKQVGPHRRVIRRNARP